MFIPECASSILPLYCSDLSSANIKTNEWVGVFYIQFKFRPCTILAQKEYFESPWCTTFQMEMESARRSTGKKNSFQYERLCTKTRFETEVRAAQEWLICPLASQRLERPVNWTRFKYHKIKTKRICVDKKVFKNTFLFTIFEKAQVVCHLL